MAFEKVPRCASEEVRVEEVFVSVGTFSQQGTQKSHKGSGPKNKGPSRLGNLFGALEGSGGKRLDSCRLLRSTDDWGGRCVEQGWGSLKATVMDYCSSEKSNNFLRSHIKTYLIYFIPKPLPQPYRLPRAWPFLLEGLWAPQ